MTRKVKKVMRRMALNSNLRNKMIKNLSRPSNKRSKPYILQLKKFKAKVIIQVM